MIVMLYDGTIFIPFHHVINKFFVQVLKYGHCPLSAIVDIFKYLPSSSSAVLMQFPEEISVDTETGRQLGASSKKTFN